MKRYLLVSLLLGISTLAVNAQHDHSSHQKQMQSPKSDTLTKTPEADPSTQKKLLQLLASYYNIKNALVAGDVTSAASNAGEYLRTVNTIDYKVLSESNIHILAKDAGKIAESKDLAKQRLVFAALSTNMASIGKTIKLSKEPVYIQYCPMKKASWLSAEKEIRNPYYGSTMLTCGEVTGTL